MIRIKKPIFAIFLVLGLFVLGYFIFGRSNKPIYDFVVAKRGNILQQVSVTGKVKPVENVDLSFEKGGKINWIGVKVGEIVFYEQVLLQLDNSELSAQLEQAEANKNIQKAKLDELEIGTRPEEIQIQETKVQSAKINYEESKKNLMDKLQDAYTKSEDAVRNKIDQFFTDPRGFNPQLTFYVDDLKLETDIEHERLNIEISLLSWKFSLDQLKISSDLDSYIETTKNNLLQIRLFLEKIALAVNKAVPNSTLTQTTIDTWKADVSTARTNVNTAVTNLSAAEEKLKTAESNLAVAENELTLKKAGTVAEQITAQEAELQQAQAQVQLIQAQINKTILRSPINGIITKQDPKLGEIVSAAQEVVSVISIGNFEAEANIPEVDIAKVKAGDSTDVTLDAYGPDVVFQAQVIKIDPAETVIEGVSTYKATLQFIKEDERLKSGMTANIDITTAKAENVISVPQRAVTSKNGDKTVKILDDKKIKEVKVKTGIKGVDGNIEILEGIKEGDKVITFIKEK